MSAHGVRRLLWITSLFIVPFPILVLGPGLVPPAHQLELGLLALAFGALESTQGVTLTLAAVFLLQSTLAAALLWFGAWAVARALARLPATARTAAALLLVLLGLAVGIAEPIYETPFSSRSAHSNLLDVYR